jgi:hypothetical protein
MEKDKAKLLESVHEQITKELGSLFHEKMNDFLQTNCNSLTDADVVILIMNLTISTSVNVYSSFKKYFTDESQLDLNYIKVRVINALSDAFEEMSHFSTKDEDILRKLTPEQIKQLLDDGEITYIDENGHKMAITQDNIMMKKSDAEKWKEKIVAELSARNETIQ